MVDEIEKDNVVKSDEESTIRFIAEQFAIKASSGRWLWNLAVIISYLALVLSALYFLCNGKEVETAKLIISFATGIVNLIVGFYFGQRSVETPVPKGDK